MEDGIMTAQQSSVSESDQPVSSASSEETIKQEGTDLRQMVSEAAYFIAEHRGFEGGNMDEDWYLAEAEIEAKLSKELPH